MATDDLTEATFTVPEVVVGTELEIPTYSADTMTWSVAGTELTTGNLQVTGGSALSDQPQYLTTYNSVDYATTDTGALTITSGTGMSVSIGENFTIMQPSGCQMRLENGGAFVFSASSGKDMLRIEPDGRFVVKGESVTTNLDVYRGFREWLGRAGF